MVDLSGWKLRKKSSTGTDSSLREFLKGSAIAPSGYFVWASSVNSFAQSITADASSTGTLAANNSVALFDGSGAQVDAVAWGTGTNQYVEGPVKRGDSVAIVEDVVTTGGSSLEAIQRVEAFGLKVQRIIAIIDRMEGGAEAFAKKGYKFSSLLTIRDFGIEPPS